MPASARGEQRRREILDVTLDLVLDQGFGTLTLDHVATRAGASKTTLMRFFGGRHGLIEAALEREMELVLGPLVEAAGDLDRFGAAFQQVIFSPRCLQLLRYVVGASVTDPNLGETFRMLTLRHLSDLATPAIAAGLASDPASGTVITAVDRYLGDLIGLEILRALTGGKPDTERLASYRDRVLRDLGDS